MFDLPPGRRLEVELSSIRVRNRARCRVNSLSGGVNSLGRSSTAGRERFTAMEAGEVPLGRSVLSVPAHTAPRRRTARLNCRAACGDIEARKTRIAAPVSFSRWLCRPIAFHRPQYDKMPAIGLWPEQPPASYVLERRRHHETDPAESRRTLGATGALRFAPNHRSSGPGGWGLFKPSCVEWRIVFNRESCGDNRGPSIDPLLHRVFDREHPYASAEETSQSAAMCTVEQTARNATQKSPADGSNLVRLGDTRTPVFGFSIQRPAGTDA